MGEAHDTFRECIGDAAWRELLNVGTLRSYRPGTFILRQGEAAGFVLALENGRVKLVATAADGAQLLLTVRGGGHLIGELADEGHGRRNASVIAIDRCTARYLPAPVFERFLALQDLQKAFSRYVVGKFDQTVERQVDLANRRSGRRIAKLLLDVVRLAPAGSPDPHRVPFTQEELSASLGMARSTIAEQLGAFRQAGALGPGPALIVTDVDCLTTFAKA
ncbi:Crp/Fnr family transcriptional regulator [Kribbella sp. NBC_01245]|uniref:Crp/Fnr family transcriptional regulator n=1 Tax=Kribbella sp. NBC_01245 TaxID=2903578 RepID=UPI002E27F16B|nr:Crp/Fnr family transcriptional regulator [Kribbella sp. NBC_01245]